MKIAICLSGLVRTYRQTYENFRDNLIRANPNDEIDIFISTHFTEHSNDTMERVRRLRWYGEDYPPFPEDHIDYKDIYALYNPRGITVEAMLKCFVPDHYVQTPGISMKSVMAMMYKIRGADLLRRYTEAAENFKYDLVVRTRFDVMYPQPIIFEKIDRSKIHVPSMMQPHILGPGHQWYNDKFAIGDSNNMLIYSDWVSAVPELIASGVAFQPETMLFEHLSRSNVCVQELGYDLELVRFK